MIKIDIELSVEAPTEKQVDRILFYLRTLLFLVPGTISALFILAVFPQDGQWSGVSTVVGLLFLLGYTVSHTGG